MKNKFTLFSPGYSKAQEMEHGIRSCIEEATTFGSEVRVLKSGAWGFGLL